MRSFRVKLLTCRKILMFLFNIKEERTSGVLSCRQFQGRCSQASSCPAHTLAGSPSHRLAPLELPCWVSHWPGSVAGPCGARPPSKWGGTPWGESTCCLLQPNTGGAVSGHPQPSSFHHRYLPNSTASSLFFSNILLSSLL